MLNLVRSAESIVETECSLCDALIPNPAQKDEVKDGLSLEMGRCYQSLVLSIDST